MSYGPRLNPGPPAESGPPTTTKAIARPVSTLMARAVRPSGSKTSTKARIWAPLRSRNALGSTPRSSTRCPPVYTVAARASTITSSGKTDTAASGSWSRMGAIRHRHRCDRPLRAVSPSQCRPGMGELRGARLLADAGFTLLNRLSGRADEESCHGAFRLASPSQRLAAQPAQHQQARGGDPAADHPQAQGQPAGMGWVQHHQQQGRDHRDRHRLP